MIALCAFICGCLFWAGINALAYSMGERAERALRIRRARYRDHSRVPSMRGAA